MKTLKALLHSGVLAKHSFKETNDLVLINTISLSGSTICFTLLFVAIPTLEWVYLGLTLLTGLTCLMILVSNYFRKYQLAFFFFMGVVPAVMMSFVILFGPLELSFISFQEPLSLPTFSILRNGSRQSSFCTCWLYSL